MTFLRLALFTLIFTLSAPLTLLSQDGSISTETGSVLIEKDAAMAVKIREIIEELGGYEDITVIVSSGIVTLRGTTVDASAGERLGELVGRVDGVVAIENKVSTSTDIAERLSPVMTRFVERLKQVVAFLPLAMVGILTFAAIIFAGFFVARLRQPWNNLAPNAFIADIFRTLIRLATIALGVVVVLDILGATALLSTILGAAGIIGLALGFAVRDTVENFIASLLLSVRQPFRPNDIIEIAGDVGKVIRLTSRATILLSMDGNHIRIPNATVFKSRIINYTRNRERRFQFPIKLAAGEDTGAALDKGIEELQRLEFVLEKPAPSAWIDQVSDGGATLCFAGWIDQHESHYELAKGEAMRLVKHALTMPKRSTEKSPEIRDVSANSASAEAAELDKLVKSDRDANQESDLLSHEGMDE